MHCLCPPGTANYMNQQQQQQPQQNHYYKQTSNGGVHSPHAVASPQSQPPPSSPHQSPHPPSSPQLPASPQSPHNSSATPAPLTPSPTQLMAPDERYTALSPQQMSPQQNHANNIPDIVLTGELDNYFSGKSLSYVGLTALGVASGETFFG